jgi:hypothetical protein
VTFQRGASGNPAGRAKGKPTRRTARLRKIIADSTGEIVEGIIKDAKANDPTARQLFLRFLMPRHQFVAEPVDLPEAKSAAEIQAQIARLASLAGAGVLDLDSMTAISRVLTMALGARLEELETLVGEKEAQAPDDV